ncbi:MAG: hypothetical protein ACKOEG_08705, partial [Chthoniobacterales bacterium]
MDDTKSPETPALPAHQREAALPEHRPDPALPAPEGGDGQREGGRRGRFRNFRRGRNNRRFRDDRGGDRDDRGPRGGGDGPSDAGEPLEEEPSGEPVFAEGIVEVSGKGFGFLRNPKRNFTQSNNDIFVTPEVVRAHNLRDGVWIKGEIRKGSRGPQLFRCTEIEGQDPAKYAN